MTIIDKLKDKRCRDCKYYNDILMACTIGYRLKLPKLICFEKEVEKDE